MEIMVLENGAVVLQMEGGISFKFVLREVDPLHLPPVQPDPTSHPVICARFQYFDDAQLVSQEYCAFRPHEFTSHATNSLHWQLGWCGLSRRAIDPTLTQFFSSGESAEKLISYSNSKNSIGYFCLDITRQGWLGSPYHRFEEEARAAARAWEKAAAEAEAAAAAMEEEEEEEEEEQQQQQQQQEQQQHVVYEDYMPLRPTRPQSIRALGKFTWSLAAQCFVGIDCAICLERLIEGDPTTLMRCRKHYFHTHCLVRWLNINNRCPVCRYYMPSTASLS